jgi:hypothetical protein
MRLCSSTSPPPRTDEVGDRDSELRSRSFDQGPWVATIQPAGQAWLDRQQDRDEFSRSILDPDDHGKHSILHALSRDGRTTAVVYLLTNTYKGWRLQGENLCQ